MNYLEKMFKSIYKQASHDTVQEKCLWRVVNQMASSTEAWVALLGSLHGRSSFPWMLIICSPVTGVCS